MVKNVLKALVISSAVVMSSAAIAGDKSPVRIELTKSSFIGKGMTNPIVTNLIVITSMQDNLRIDNLRLNRGNCKFYPSNKYLLKFGDRVKIAYHCSTLLEAEISTSAGTWTYTFNN